MCALHVCWRPIVRNTLVGRLRPRSARGWLQAKPLNQNDCVFVILVTHPKSYIETTDRRDFGGKPSKWRSGQVLSWKIPELLVCRVCNQVFGRYRSLKGDTRRKVYWFQKCYSFRSTTKNNEVIAENPFQNSGASPSACERLELTLVVNTSF